MALRLDFNLERGDSLPLYEQLREELARQIAEGGLEAGTRLPSTRDVASRLSVNRATAVQAYRRLEEDGLVERRAGSGTYVRLARTESSSGAGAGALRSRALRRYERADQRRELPPAPEGAIDLAGIAPDEKKLPLEDFRRCLGVALDERGGDALGYGPPAGDPRLREVLAERLTARGMPVDASQVLVVGGAQQGLDLIFRAVLDPGDVVITESPSYHFALDLLRFHGAELATVELLPSEEGQSTLRFDQLEEVLLRRRPVAYYGMPTFQNPTGLTLDGPSRRRLAATLAASGTLLVEDDYQAELRYQGDAVPPVSALPEAGATVYVGTLSKALFPGLRVGWIVAGNELLERITLVKRLSDLSGSVLLQAAAAEFLASGAHDRHLVTVLEENRARMDLLGEALADALPPGCTVTAPRGGHAAWLSLPPRVSGAALAARAAALGVMVSAGEAFRVDGSDEGAVRLSIARAGRDEIPRAAARIGEALRELIAEGKERGRPPAPLDVPLRI